MPFINASGQIVSSEDVSGIKKMYEEIFNSYHDSLVELQQFMPKSPFYPPIFAQMEKSKADFMNAIDEAFASDKKIKLNDFLDEELSKYAVAVDKVADKKNRMLYPDFKKNFIADFSGKLNKTAIKDTYEGLEQSMGSFSLTKTAFPGMEDINDFNPNVDRDDALAEVRKANSNTLDVAESEDSPAAQAAEIGYRMSLKVASSQASLLMGKDKVGFNDLYETFTTINKMVRADDPEGGKLRGETVYFGDNKSIAPVSIPGHLYHTLSKIADNINIIKQTKDPLVQKSQAVQLASFTYQMMVSEHIFKDGNGRSCRMFADTILQTFGLPSHTPNYLLTSTGGTIGKKLDFDRGAKLFYEGVKTSDTLMKIGNAERVTGIENQAKSLLASVNINNSELILKNVSPKKAISMAITAKENVFGFIETLNDFAKADHLLSFNSKQYNDVIAKAGEVRDILQNNGPGSLAVKKKFAELRKDIEEYEAHCRRHPKDNKTRNARLATVFDFKKSMYYIESQAKQIGKFEAQEIMDNQFHPIQDNIIRNYQDKPTPEGIAQFILLSAAEKDLNKYIEGNFTEDTPYKSIDEIRRFVNTDPKLVDFVANSPALRDAVKESFMKPGYASLSTKDQLSDISASFEKICRNQAKNMSKAAENQEPVNQKKATEKAKTNAEESLPGLFSLS